MSACLTGYNVSMTGVLTAAPSSASDNTFPAGSTMIPFATTPDPKPANVSTGDVQVTVNTGTYLPLPGVGSAVTQGTFLYFRCNTTMKVRTTTYNALGNIQAVEVVNGMKVVEYDAGAYLVLLEVLGSGALEYFASGPL